ncbi:MAG: hypothetical protein AB1796_11500 [Bacillota bacterium]
MFLYTVSIAAAIFILMIVGFRLMIHFHFCRRVSARYPGEKLKGCPIWTHTNYGKGRGNGGIRKITGSESMQHISNNLQGGVAEEKKLEETNQSQLSFQQNSDDYQAVPV